MGIVEVQRPGVLYQCVTVLLFLILLGIVMGITSPDLSDTDIDVVANEVHLPVIVATALVYLFIAVRLLSAPAKFLNAFRHLKTLLPLILFCILSGAWSTNPSVTFRRGLFLMLSTVGSFVLGIDFEPDELVRLLAAACLVNMLLCAVVFMVRPSFLYSPSDPTALKGLTTHKNIFGFEQGIALLAFLFVPFRKFHSFRWPLVALAGVLLIQSHSSGALAGTICAFLAVPLLFVSRLRGSNKISIAMATLIIILVSSVLLLRNASLIPQLLSKDSTLTGRTQLWSLVVVAIGRHLLFGYGFDSFWQGLQGDSLSIIHDVGWLVPTAHNGYLDLLLGIGAVGMFLFLPPLIQTVLRSFQYGSIGDSSYRFFPLAFLIFWLVCNIDESVLLTRTGIPFFLFSALSVSLAVSISARNDKMEAVGYRDRRNRSRPHGTLAPGSSM